MPSDLLKGLYLANGSEEEETRLPALQSRIISDTSFKIN